MTTIEIELPDQLADEAKRAGLLQPATFARILREYLKPRKTEELFAAMERMSTVEAPAPTPEEIAEELHALRAERGNRYPSR